MTPIKAIRAKCLDCCCGQVNEVKLCSCPDCSLHPYRLGKNPNIKLTDEQRAARAAHFKNKPSQQGNFERLAPSEGSYTARARAGGNPQLNPAN